MKRKIQRRSSVSSVRVRPSRATWRASGASDAITTAISHHCRTRKSANVSVLAQVGAVNPEQNLQRGRHDPERDADHDRAVPGRDEYAHDVDGQIVDLETGEVAEAFPFRRIDPAREEDAGEGAAEQDDERRAEQ